ncbi:Stage II sporulation protein [Posidoniimonas polymericola]|uniref:Stage II sporulation protein n=1 Tax=Posidoniimonas polymericola TaxID=2528002 RepID=A0A5C5YV78_9BACT|nr:SpoIID/LytB domain-containing protein [Posidoniimonas polymericola]TWT78437.1 Stage II sporulation protein [Posidoniimonas polymericola]
MSLSAAVRQLARVAAVMAATLFSAVAVAQFTALPNINVIGSGSVPTDTDYVPNCVLCENGGASYEALKAQAVAARTYAYYKMDRSGSIADGTVDQVYSCSGSPQAIHYAAARDTEGEILSIENFGGGDVLIAAFYVAGAIPTGPFDPANPSAVPNAGDSDPTNTQKWVTYPYENGLSGGTNTGTPLGFQGTRTNPNWPNRGAKSQNGADFLSDNSVSYVDILKYYYGADIQLRTASTAGTSVTYGRKVLTSFDNYADRSRRTYQGHEGYFNRDPTYSGSTTANIAGSTAERSADTAHEGTHSQLIDITYDESSGEEFLLRHVSAARFSDFGGSQNVAAGVANLRFEADGAVGFWLKTDDPGLTVSIALDDPDTGERGVFKEVIADNQWRQYRWFIDRDEDWDAWSGGNGVVDGDLVTVDSIQIKGSSDAQVYLDTVFWDPSAEFEPRFSGDYNRDGVVDAADYTTWRSLNGAVGGRIAADGNDDGVVDELDLAIWRNNYDSGAAVSPQSDSAPEPSSLAGLLGVALCRWIGRRARCVKS